MTDFNAEKNVAVWFDLPVADLDRAVEFYSGVLANKVSKMEMEGCEFAILDHQDGNGGCLVLKPDEITPDKGLMLYLNVEGRIQDAAAKVTELGGQTLEPIHPIGPYGFRTIILDSEGNRIVLHSQTDA